MKFVILALFVAGAYGCGLPTFPPVLNRVVGGHDVREHSWPWQVSLHYQSSFGYYYHSCGASLISNQWIMTAAHCISKSKRYKVFLGKHNLENPDEAGSMDIVPAKIIVHEYWDSSRTRNDLALIKLPSPISFSDTIMAACLPELGVILPHNAPCYLTGWGRLTSGGPTSDILQQVLLPVVSHATCTRPDWWGSIVTTNMLCAGGDGNVASCNGDSGGPLNCQNPDGSWTVHGVVSFGSGMSCNYPKRASVFTRVSAYINWINRVMMNN